jgi:hypothetical protein
MNVLISLHRGYGLGDAVQMSAVLQHVVKYRPEWTVDYRAEPGRHCVGQGIVRRTFAYGEEPQDTRYSAEVLICLYDTWANWQDRPNTRVSSCLHEHFGLPWDSECGRYIVNVTPQQREDTETILCGRDIVAIHHRGDSDKVNKDLTDEQAKRVCDHVLALGYLPLLINWRAWSVSAWGGDAQRNCALIAGCRAFVGIDSGPSKCASATDTPALVVWTGHHPAPFHDPAPNTTHLVPVGYHGLRPVCNDPGVIGWFEAHHRVRKYEKDPVAEVGRWLTEVLT